MKSRVVISPINFAVFLCFTSTGQATAAGTLADLPMSAETAARWQVIFEESGIQASTAEIALSTETESMERFPFPVHEIEATFSGTAVNLVVHPKTGAPLDWRPLGVRQKESSDHTAEEAIQRLEELRDRFEIPEDWVRIRGPEYHTTTGTWLAVWTRTHQGIVVRHDGVFVSVSDDDLTLDIFSSDGPSPPPASMDVNIAAKEAEEAAKTVIPDIQRPPLVMKAPVGPERAALLEKLEILDTPALQIVPYCPDYPTQSCVGGFTEETLETRLAWCVKVRVKGKGWFEIWIDAGTGDFVGGAYYAGWIYK